MKVNKLHPKVKQIKNEYFNPTHEDINEGIWLVSVLPVVNIAVLMFNLFSNEHKNVKGIILLGNIICYSIVTLLIWKPI